ncbi:LysR family transcriptional regulator [Ferruginibacter paludis]|uniref:winged helix-turn-helix domain-containing protein n=1 Tax=Ferruginibacter paludis TaxID=1310417 RepID=UPI0025B3D96D|nr:LysR family transcriptional regulator [Ferruginibacter paludis]MDN3657937.1 LysR family transcriptional regulator [Ferruginibacter paludis]
MPASKKKLPLAADGRIWISTAEGKLVGKGRIELLEKIKQYGSIRQAAMAMEMSYRQAWQLIDDMNTKAQTPLVISTRGGKGGGNATVTEKGEQYIALFNSFNKKFQQLLAQQTQHFIF